MAKNEATGGTVKVRLVKGLQGADGVEMLAWGKSKKK